MNDDYLWGKTGDPDPEVERLEKLLGRFRQDLPAPHFPAPEPRHQRAWLWGLGLRWSAATAILLLTVVACAWYGMRWLRSSWVVERVEGAPRVGWRRIGDTGRLVVGEWLETNHSSRARISVGEVGEVEVEPNTRIRLVEARRTEHRLALQRGTVHARIWAPPRLFYVDTPSAVAVDLGCRYTLQVDEKGAGRIRVTLGWVAFEQRGRESFVPAGAMCITRPDSGPGTPYFEDASPAFRGALEKLDFELGGITGGVGSGMAAGEERRLEALESVLAEARERDAITLWHLLSRTQGAERLRVYDRLAQLVPPPAGVTREGVLRGESHMRDLWWDALGLGDTSWWRMWKGPVPNG
jgi:hypothetical protein